MHVIQANLLRAPAGCAHADVLDRWHSVVDIAEIAAAGGARVTVVQASDRAGRIARSGIDYRFVELPGGPATPPKALPSAPPPADSGSLLDLNNQPPETQPKGRKKAGKKGKKKGADIEFGF